MSLSAKWVLYLTSKWGYMKIPLASYGAAMATCNPAVNGPARQRPRPLPAHRESGQDDVRARGCLAMLWAGCVLAASAYGLTLLLPAWVRAAGGSPAQAGLIYWCGALGAGGALLFGGRLARRAGAGWAAARLASAASVNRTR